MVASACRLRNACNCVFFPRLRRGGLNTVTFQLYATDDQLRARQLDQLLITLNKAYKHHSQQDMPETIFYLLFNQSLTTEQDKTSGDGHARKSKHEIHRLLWTIIQNKREASNCDKPWTPGSMQYPALIVQLLRIRSPSPEPDVRLPNCVRLSIEDFVKYTSS